MLSALDPYVHPGAGPGGRPADPAQQIASLRYWTSIPGRNELITNEVFRWHPATDEIRYSGKSYILEQIMEDRGWSEERMREELKRRQEVLEWMRIKRSDITRMLARY